MIIRLAVSLLLAALPIAAASAQPAAQTAAYDIIGIDGTPVLNHIVPVDAGNEIKKLPDVVSVGNRQGDVTIYEFYDLNCPYCRKASIDLRAMLAADKKLDLVLVPFPVLGVASIQAGRVEFAVARLASPLKFYLFHQKMFSARGVNDGERALAVAQELGLARDKVLALANAESVTDAMKAHVALGDEYDMQATPSLIVQDVAIIGYPGREALEKIVAAVRRCGKAAC
ncbi:MAG TPA: thioredoxin domain-containing protein [Xanthobacteraceae bacterium]|nr:thioredoxin domain-containing protein [Xanthobacteraceae bacterium]